jgi:hypothetical protein
VDADYVLDLYIKGDNPEALIDLRFIDTKTGDPGDHPWRMRYTIDGGVADLDGSWQHLQLPLKDFSEHGAWDGGWYEPVGAFDWSEIDRFEIVAEHHTLEGTSFWFDQIRLADPNSTVIEPATVTKTGGFELHQNLPNPFNPRTTIRYRLPARVALTGGRLTRHVELTIHNVLGQNITTLVSENQQPGIYRVEWDATGFPAGLYLYSLRIDQVHIKTRKLLLLK